MTRTTCTPDFSLSSSFQSAQSPDTLFKEHHMSDAFSATQTATIPHIIDGQKVLSDGRVGNVYNPATGQVTGQVNFADSELMSQAVDAAEARSEEHTSELQSRFDLVCR